MGKSTKEYSLFLTVFPFFFLPIMLMLVLSLHDQNYITAIIMIIIIFILLIYVILAPKCCRNKQNSKEDFVSGTKTHKNDAEWAIESKRSLVSEMDKIMAEMNRQKVDFMTKAMKKENEQRGRQVMRKNQEKEIQPLLIEVNY